MQKDLQISRASVDPDTGFLSFPPDPRTKKAFNSQAKVKFLDAFLESGDKGQAMVDLGFSIRILKSHLKADPEFNAAYEEIIDRMEAKVEANMYKQGLTPRGALMGFGWLRANRPGKWAPKANLEASKGKDSALDELLKKAIDITPAQQTEKPGE